MLAAGRTATPPVGIDRPTDQPVAEPAVEHEQLQLDVSAENFRTQLPSGERDH